MCLDRASSSDWLFGLCPGHPQRFEPIDGAGYYQWVRADGWPCWGRGHDLDFGKELGKGSCDQGASFAGTKDQICGGVKSWGEVHLETWFPAE